MAKVRVDEFARNLGVSVDVFMEALRQSGVEVSSYLDMVDLDTAYQAHVQYQKSLSSADVDPALPSAPTEMYESSTEELTQAYESSSDNSNATGTYDQDNPTGIYGDSQKSSPADFCTYHNLGPGDQIELPEGIYLIEKVLSSSRNTGEASVFQIKGEDQCSYALKLYYKFDDPRHEPNAEALERISTISDPDILKLHAFGTGAKKYKNLHCYEISDLALGGTLLDVTDLKEKYTPEFIRSNVIPEIHKGLLCLHKQGIYHCDIKPENIFYLDAEQTDLVIGDYGSAKTPETPLAHTSTVKGTSIYLAPEQARQIISPKNDYYSFGMTLVRLLYPEQMTKDGLSKIYTRGTQRKKILDFKPELSEFNDLIGGLTLYDHEARWGDKEVERWMAGESVPVVYGHDIPPVKLGHGQEIRSDLDLIRILTEENNWYQLLFAEQSSVDVLCRWVGDFLDLDAAKDFNALIRYYKNQENRDYLREAAIRFFNPQRPVIIPPKQYDLWNTESIQEETANVIAHLDDLWSQAKEDELRCYLLQLEITLHHLMLQGTAEQQEQARNVYIKVLATLNREAKPVEHLEKNSWKVELTLTPDQIIDLAYKFNPDRGLRYDGSKNIKTLKEVGCYFARHPQQYNEKIAQTERYKFLIHNNHGSIVHSENLSYFLFKALEDEVKTQARLEDKNISRVRGEYTFKISFGRSLQDFFTKEKIDYKRDSWNQGGSETLTLKSPSFPATLSKAKVSSSLVRDSIGKLCNEKRLNQNEFDKTGKANLTKQFKEAIRHDVSIRRNKFIFLSLIATLIFSSAIYIHYFYKKNIINNLNVANTYIENGNVDSAFDQLYSIHGSFILYNHLFTAIYSDLFNDFKNKIENAYIKTIKRDISENNTNRFEEFVNKYGRWINNNKYLSDKYNEIIKLSFNKLLSNNYNYKSERKIIEEMIYNDAISPLSGNEIKLNISRTIVERYNKRKKITVEEIKYAQEELTSPNYKLSNNEKDFLNSTVVKYGGKLKFKFENCRYYNDFPDEEKSFLGGSSKFIHYKVTGFSISDKLNIVLTVESDGVDLRRYNNKPELTIGNKKVSCFKNSKTQIGETTKSIVEFDTKNNGIKLNNVFDYKYNYYLGLPSVYGFMGMHANKGCELGVTKW